MALWFRLMVNEGDVGMFEAVRRERVIPADRVCTYDVTVTGRAGQRRAVVRHDYDRGALALVRHALDAILADPISPTAVPPPEAGSSSTSGSTTPRPGGLRRTSPRAHVRSVERTGDVRRAPAK